MCSSGMSTAAVDGVGDLVHGVRAEDEEVRARGLQRPGRPRRAPPRPRPSALGLHALDGREVDRVRQAAGRVQAAAAVPHQLVGEPVVLRGRLPAHAAEEPDELHGSSDVVGLNSARDRAVKAVPAEDCRRGALRGSLGSGMPARLRPADPVEWPRRWGGSRPASRAPADLRLLTKHYLAAARDPRTRTVGGGPGAAVRRRAVRRGRPAHPRHPAGGRRDGRGDLDRARHRGRWPGPTPSTPPGSAPAASAPT